MRNRLTLFLITLGGIGGVTPVLAHGAHIEYQPTESIQIQAKFDSGEPMKEAQVMVYAPDNPSEPWTQGTTDDQGRFVFAPDATQPGNWEVSVRQAGHGDIVAIPVGAASAVARAADGSGSAANADEVESATVAPQTDALSPVQQGITIGAVIWGFIGTALFFARGKR